MRLFFALWPTQAAADRLAAVAADAASRWGGRPTRRDTLHLTLAFLGEVSDEDVARLIELAKVMPAPGFAVRVDQLGHWRHNRLIWAGCREVPPALQALVTALHARLATGGFAISNAERPFTPHVTLVRKIPEHARFTTIPTVEPIEWQSADFVLVRSRLSASGPSYESLARFALADASPSA